jgi:UDP-N-acetylglucosamine 2-epimerase (non-hydrolysing)
MEKIKVVTIVGTRPEIIRLSRVLHALDHSGSFEHILIHTGQNYDFELNEIFFQELGLRKPDYFLEAAGKTSITTIGNTLIAIEPILQEVNPAAVLILGDTNSALSAIAARKLGIPIFHMEAGNRCFDIRVPEESNRKLVDHIADINLVYSDIAREYLLREGMSADRIIKTGSPMYEVLHHYLPLIEQSNVVSRLKLTPQQYFVVSAHREENVNHPVRFQQLMVALEAIAETYQLPVIMSTHPRTMKILQEKGIQLHPLIQSMKPLGLPDYIQLQRNAKAVLSDSGTISEESSILNFPALNIREAHERPEAMEEGAVMMTGVMAERILQGVQILESQTSGVVRNFRLVSDYSMPNVSEKVIRIILSYTDYVNRANKKGI